MGKCKHCDNDAGFSTSSNRECEQQVQRRQAETEQGQDIPDLYAVLQVHYLADPEVITAAYRRLVQMYHPDMNKSDDANAMMASLNRAYGVLLDPDKRAQYDRQRGYQQAPARPEPKHEPESSPRPERRYSIDVNATNKHGMTALYGAVFNKDAESVRQLISDGADVSVADAFGYTPLHWAAFNGQTEIIRMLISAGADVHAKGEIGNTPLHGSAMGEQTEAVRVLISAGADVNVADDESGYTPLHWAAFNGQTEIIRMLISAGTGVNVRSSEGQTPLDVATDEGHIEAIRALIAAGAETGDI